MSLPTKLSGSELHADLSPLSDDGPSTEIYRQVLVSLNLPPDSRSVIGVTSAIAGEGRTTVALGLARMAANDLKVKVLLVEVDLERPSLAKHFGILSSPGLCEVLRGQLQLKDVLRLPDATRRESQNLSVVTAGAPEADAARLLRRLPDLDPFRDPEGPASIVILDLPPIMNHSYTPLAASVADALVLVVRAGVTPVDVIREAISRLDGQSPRGVVLNGVQTALPSWWPQ